MGLTMEIRCPKCTYKTTGHLGMGEEMLEADYTALAQKELEKEHPAHTSKSWQFIDSTDWANIEAACYAILESRE